MDDPAPANTFANIEAPFNVNPNDYFHAGMVGNDIVPANDIPVEVVQVVRQPPIRRSRAKPLSDAMNSQRLLFEALPEGHHWKNLFRYYSHPSQLVSFLNYNNLTTNKTTMNEVRDNRLLDPAIQNIAGLLPDDPLYDIRVLAWLNKAVAMNKPTAKRRFEMKRLNEPTPFKAKFDGSAEDMLEAYRPIYNAVRLE